MQNTLRKVIVKIFILTLCLNTVSALRINELMYNPEGTDTGREWIELYNDNSHTVDLTTYRLYENEVNHIIASYFGSSISPGEYAILTSNPESFLLDYPDYSGVLVQTAFSLSNTGELIAVKNESFDTVDEIEYTTELANGNNHSLEWVDGVFLESLQAGGTPGSLNHVTAQVPEFSGLTFAAGGMIALLGIILYRRRFNT